MTPATLDGLMPGNPTSSAPGRETCDFDIPKNMGKSKYHDMYLYILYIYIYLFI